MTFPLTLIVIVLSLGPVDSDARTVPRAADQSFQSAMPTVPAPEIDATTAHRPRSPVPRTNKPISARTLRPRLNVKPQQAFATIPMASHLPRLRSIRLL